MKTIILGFALLTLCGCISSDELHHRHCARGELPAAECQLE